MKDRIEECKPRNSKLIVEPVGFIVIHRTSLALAGPDNPSPIADADLDGPKLAAAFQSNAALGTGCLIPYHIIIRVDGRAEQLLPLDVQGAHVKGHNFHSLGVAYVGAEQCNDAQYRTIVRTCLALVWHYKCPIVRHDKTPGYTQQKVCPHASFSLPMLVRDIRDRLACTPHWRATPEQRTALILQSEGLRIHV